MCLFKRKKKTEPKQQARVAAIIYNASNYTLDDNRLAPKRKHFDLAIVDTNGVLTAEPTQPITIGRTEAYNEALRRFYKMAFGTQELPQDIKTIEECINKALWCNITIF